MKPIGFLVTASIITFSLFAIWISPVWLQLVLFGATVLAVLMHFEKSGPMHPAAWFSVFLFLYSANYPLFVLGLGVDYPQLRLILPLNYIALVSFLVGIFPASRKALSAPNVTLNASALRIFVIVLLIGCCGLIVFTLSLGLGSKREFIDTSRRLGIAPLFIIFQLLTISYLVYAMRLSQKYMTMKGLRDVYFTPIGQCVFVVLVLSFGATGERDVIFRFVLLLYFCLFATGREIKYRFWHYIVIGFSGIYLAGIFQVLKGFLLSSNVDGGSGIRSLFWNEFASAGRNLDFIITRDVERLNGQTYLWAFQRFFDFLFPDAISATQWFNSELRYEFDEGGSSGWGFSLVAEAYLNFGPMGIVCVFFLVGLLSAAMYGWARKSAFGFAFYLLFVPTLIYVSRADIGNLLSLTFKVNIFLILTLWVVVQAMDLASKRFSNFNSVK